jgi:hypothetical protein
MVKLGLKLHFLCGLLFTQTKGSDSFQSQFKKILLPPDVSPCSFIPLLFGQQAASLLCLHFGD